MIQNEALYDICTTQLKNKSPTHKDLNGLIAKVMSGFTSESFFYPGDG
jgi:tubulin beta